MNNQAIELREGDTIVSVGLVLEAQRRLGWVRLTVQPAEGTPICFDLPSAIVVQTDRPVPPRIEQDLPWSQPKGPNPTPRVKVNPTPIPVPKPDPVTPGRPKHSASATSSATGVFKVRRHTSDPEQ